MTTEAAKLNLNSKIKQIPLDFTDELASNSGTTHTGLREKSTKDNVEH